MQMATSASSFYQENNYYRGYLLDDGAFDFNLSVDEKSILDACIWIIDNKATIRQTAKEFGMAKSTLHSKIHKYLCCISFELYECVKHQFKENKGKYFK